MMLHLPNGKPIDETMLELAMEDANLEHAYFLHTQTGEVVFLSEYDRSDESEKLMEEREGGSQYVPIERIPTHIAYQWMEDFVESIVAPRNERAAEKLSIALRGKGHSGDLRMRCIVSAMSGYKSGITGGISSSKKLCGYGSRVCWRK